MHLSPKLLHSFGGFAVVVLLALPGMSAQDFTTLTALPEEVPETSGIELTAPNEVWTFNDSGGEAALYLCDTMGNLLRTVHIANAWNRDWEDITQDEQGNFYIGNIGNNANTTTDLTIFKIPNPTVNLSDTLQAEVISFTYEDQTAFPPSDDSLHFDCEALMWFDGNLYLSTKNRSEPFDGYTHLYRLPDEPGEHVAQRISSFDTEGNVQLLNWITAGDISPNGSQFVLLSTDKLWLFYDFEGDDFFGGQHLRVDLPFPSQKEAICFVNETRLYITDEEVGGLLGRQLYALDISGLPSSAMEIETVPLALFPNPTTGRLHVALEGKSPVHAQLWDATGRLLFRQKLEAGEALDLSSCPSGLYLLVIWQNGRRYRQQVVKI